MAKRGDCNAGGDERPSACKQRKTNEVPLLVSMGSREVLQWMLGDDMSVDTFLSEHWEKKHYLVKRSRSSYWDSACSSGHRIFSLQSLIQLSSQNGLHFGNEVRVTRTVDGVRHQYDGQPLRASRKRINQLLSSGWTLQVLQPQQHCATLQTLLAKLEEFFGDLVGCNSYVTPGSHQGLAPHYDDVEVFVMQLEGRKRWRLYKPLFPLPAHASSDLDESIIGDPILEVTLEPGDMLYFPRGTIHQAFALDSTPSHHVTVSTYQNRSWRDFLQGALLRALDRAAAKDVRFRQGVPPALLSTFGEMYRPGPNADAAEPQPSPLRQRCEAHVHQLLSSLAHYVDMDQATDELALDFMRNRLPPFEGNPHAEGTAVWSSDGECSAFEGYSDDQVEPMEFVMPEDISSVVGDEDNDDDDDADGDDDGDDAGKEEKVTADVGDAVGEDDERLNRSRCNDEDGEQGDDDESDSEEEDSEEDSDEGGENPIGPPPSHDTDHIWVRWALHGGVRIVLDPVDPMLKECSTATQTTCPEQDSIQVFHSLHNSAERHMSGTFPNELDEWSHGPIIFPGHTYLPALRCITSTSPKWAKLVDLPGVESVDDAVALCSTLWLRRLLETRIVRLEEKE